AAPRSAPLHPVDEHEPRGRSWCLPGYRGSVKNRSSARRRVRRTSGGAQMNWKFAAGLLMVFVVEAHAPPPADACGVKLTVKSQAPRKAVARTPNPWDVLLLGTPPRRLERDLSAAGHRVEVASSASSAKKRRYAVVITDAKHQDEARSSFGGSVVVVRSGDVAADVRS